MNAVGADLCVRPLERPFAGPWSGSGFRRRGHAMTTPTTAAPDTRDEAKANTRSGASRQKAGRFRRHRFGRPPSARRATAPERDKKRFFSLDRFAARFSFWRSKKRNGGRNGPAIIIAESPGQQIAAPTPLRRRAPVGADLGAASFLPLAPVGLPPRRERRVFRGEGRGDLWGNSGNVTFFFVEWKKNCSLPV